MRKISGLLQGSRTNTMRWHDKGIQKLGIKKAAPH